MPNENMIAQITQRHFAFAEWKDCFEVWKEYVAIYGDEIQFVLSTHRHSEGYWIEAKGTEIRDDKTDHIYSRRQVIFLEKRVREAMKRKKKTGNEQGLIL